MKLSFVNSLSANELHNILDAEASTTKEVFEAMSPGAVEEQFRFFNQEHLPVYVLSEEEAEGIESTVAKMEAKLHEILNIALFKESKLVLEEYFGPVVREYPEFLEYARYVYETNYTPALYGRMDFAYDPVAKAIKGVYEYNGDTPVMLFESTVLQNVMTTDGQFNWYYGCISSDAVKSFLQERGDNFATLVDPLFIEDSLTCEFLHNSVGVDNKTFSTLDELDFDFMTTNGSPFMVGDKHVNNIFKLKPWEEILDERYTLLFDKGRWRDWVRYVNIFEPAWRWFLSNKGIWAYATYLEESGKVDLEGLPFIKSYLDPKEFIARGVKFVGKPKHGRLSNNILVFDENAELEHAVEGCYTEDEFIYQEWVEPGRVESRNNFIGCVWMAPVVDEDGYLVSAPATFAIREFDSEVLDIKNERWIPHSVV